MKHYIGPSQYSTFHRTTYAHENNIGNPSGSLLSAANTFVGIRQQQQEQEQLLNERLDKELDRFAMQKIAEDDRRAKEAHSAPAGYLPSKMGQPNYGTINMGAPAFNSGDGAPVNWNGSSYGSPMFMDAVGTANNIVNSRPGGLPSSPSAPTFQQSAPINDPWNGRTSRMTGSIDQSKVIGSPWYGMDMNGWAPTSGGWNPMGGF